MKEKMLLSGLVLAAIVMGSSGALAASMGPPVAGLEAGKWRVGFDYSYSDMDVSIEGNQTLTVSGPPPDAGDYREEFKEKIAFESNMLFANVGYGVADNLEVFLRLGFADASFSGGGIDGDGAYEFAYGLGTKATLYEDGDLKLGGLFQMTWANFDDDVTATVEFDDEDYKMPGTGELDWYEIKVAVGPAYKLTEGVSIYGGPFYHLISGDYDSKGDQITVDPIVPYVARGVQSGDVEEESDFGFYVGGQIDFSENLPFYIEWQSTGDADVIGLSLAYRF